tara:strand:- start:3 stop:458 length:456 start_codon:yes stop_codon:yes gene_type:complete
MSHKFKLGDIVTRTSKSVWPERFGYEGIEYEVLELVSNGCIVVIEGCAGADQDLFKLVATDNNSNNNLEATAMTTSKFTETVTTNKTTIKKVIDGSLSNNSCLSVNPTSSKGVMVVVGATYKDRYCASFDKSSLQELINELQAVHDAMEKY